MIQRPRGRQSSERETSFCTELSRVAPKRAFALVVELWQLVDDQARQHCPATNQMPTCHTLVSATLECTSASCHCNQESLAYGGGSAALTNVPHGRVAHTGEPPTFAKTTPQHYPSTNTLLNTLVRRVKRTSDKLYSRSS